jgi:cell division protein FtsI/penicillin-binding protein 2
VRYTRLLRTIVGAGAIFVAVLAAHPGAIHVASDPQLQAAADRSMASHGGALIVVDVVSRTLLAATNLNLAAQRLERPGSTLKPFVLMALLESDKLNPEERLTCRRPLRIGSARLDCTHSPSISQLNADDAIAYSCNSYVSQVARRLSEAEIVEVFRRAGLDSPSGLIEREVTGRITHPKNQDELQLEALGDSGIEITALELLEAYRKLALRKRNGEVGPDKPVFDGLEHSVSYGMAHAASVDGMRIAGKTGTASSMGSARTHGFFVGYAPADKPEIALVVFIERGRGMDAAALAQPVLAEFARGSRRK